MVTRDLIFLLILEFGLLSVKDMFSSQIDITKWCEAITSALEEFCNHKQEHVESNTLNTWKICLIL